MWVIGKIEENSYKFRGVAFPKDNGEQGDTILLASPTDILSLRDRIRAETEISLRGPRFKLKSEQTVSDDESSETDAEVA
jgi:hypothetical protein